MIYPLLRRADGPSPEPFRPSSDSSLLTKGRHLLYVLAGHFIRFIPSYEGQTFGCKFPRCRIAIHPFLRRADSRLDAVPSALCDSSLPAKGRLAGAPLGHVRERFIPSCEGQALSVYAAFSRLKHLVVQFTQMPFLSHPHI